MAYQYFFGDSQVSSNTNTFNESIFGHLKYLEAEKPDENWLAEFEFGNGGRWLIEIEFGNGGRWLVSFYTKLMEYRIGSLPEDEKLNVSYKS